MAIVRSTQSETQAEVLLRFLRRSPASTQQCRDAMADSEYRLKSHQTEELVYELRDEGVIAFANGAWYVKNESRLLRVRGPAKVHPNQLKLFER